MPSIFCLVGLGFSASFLYSLAALAGSLPFGTLALNYCPLAGVRPSLKLEHPARSRHILTVAIRFESNSGSLHFLGGFLIAGFFDLLSPRSGFTAWMRPALMMSPTKRMGRLMISLCYMLSTPASELCNRYLPSPITVRVLVMYHPVLRDHPCS